MDDVRTMTIRIPAGMHEHLRRRAFDERRPMNALIISAIARDNDLPVPGDAAQAGRPA